MAILLDSITKLVEIYDLIIDAKIAINPIVKIIMGYYNANFIFIDGIKSVSEPIKKSGQFTEFSMDCVARLNFQYNQCIYPNIQSLEICGRNVINAGDTCAMCDHKLCGEIVIPNSPFFNECINFIINNDIASLKEYNQEYVYEKFGNDSYNSSITWRIKVMEMLKCCSDCLIFNSSRPNYAQDMNSRLGRSIEDIGSRWEWLMKSYDSDLNFNMLLGFITLINPTITFYVNYKPDGDLICDYNIKLIGLELPKVLAKTAQKCGDYVSNINSEFLYEMQMRHSVHDVCDVIATFSIHKNKLEGRFTWKLDINDIVRGSDLFRNEMSNLLIDNFIDPKDFINHSFLTKTLFRALIIKCIYALW